MRSRVGGVAFGGITMLAKLTLRSERERVELGVQGVLDRLECGTFGAPSARSGLMNRIEALVIDADHRPPARKGAGGPGSLADEA